MKITLEQLVASKNQIEQQKQNSLALAQQAEGALVVINKLIEVIQMKDPAVTEDLSEKNILGVHNASA